MTLPLQCGKLAVFFVQILRVKEKTSDAKQRTAAHRQIDAKIVDTK